MSTFVYTLILLTFLEFILLNWFLVKVWELEKIIGSLDIYVQEINNILEDITQDEMDEMGSDKFHVVYTFLVLSWTKKIMESTMFMRLVIVTDKIFKVTLTVTIFSSLILILTRL